MATMGPTASRRADLAEIHVARKALGWDEDMYRDVMAQVCAGVRSAGDLDAAGRQRFLEHLRACQRRAGCTPHKVVARRPWTPRHMRLWSLWQKLADAGRVQQRDRKGLIGWVKAQCGVDDVSWATQEQLDLLIDRAGAWLKREA